MIKKEDVLNELKSKIIGCSQATHNRTLKFARDLTSDVYDYWLKYSFNLMRENLENIRYYKYLLKCVEEAKKWLTSPQKTSKTQ